MRWWLWLRSQRLRTVIKFTVVNMTAQEKLDALKKLLQEAIQEQDNAPHVYVEVKDLLEIIER